jgi:hypothetical protein
MKTTRTDNQNGSTESLLQKWGVTEQELKQWWKQDEISGAEAARDDLTDVELCRALAGKFARESARRTSRNIGEIRDRYETIVLEFLSVRYTLSGGKRVSLTTVLRSKYDTDEALHKFLPRLGKWIGEYVCDCIREHSFGFTPLYRQIVPTHTWTLCGHNVTSELLTAFAEEYVRDRDGLMRFVSAVFKRWRKLNQPHSTWRVRLVVQQHGRDIPHHRIVQRLEKIDAVSKGSAVPGTKEYNRLRAKIKKYRTRDQNDALKMQSRVTTTADHG